MRLFVGAKVSIGAIGAIEAAVASMRAAADACGVRVRWVAPSTYHITLKFLGEVHREAVPAVRDAVAKAMANESGFAITTGGLGAFPDLERAQVLWVGVDDPGNRLTQLADACERALVPLGFAQERRRFHPHVTVGRINQAANLTSMLADCVAPRASETRVGSLNLYENAMKSNSSEYTVHAEWRLGEIASQGSPSGSTAEVVSGE